MLRAGGGVSVIMVLVFRVSRSPRRREGDAIAATERQIARRLARREPEVVLSYGSSFQQAQQQATVTGMGLGDDGFVVGSPQAERLPQQRHDVLLLAGLDDFRGRL